MERLIDTHAHIYLPQFKDDLNQIIERSQNAGVQEVLMPNIDRDTIEDVFIVHDKYPEICKPMVGLHPCSVKSTWKEDVDYLVKWMDDPRNIAIGEIGIDLYWDKTFEEEQKACFKYQISLAKERDLPIVIHSRNAIDLTIEIVSEMQDGKLRGIFHCFDQSLEHAKKIMDLSFLMGIGGILTYKRNHELRDAVSKIPMDCIVLETDAPYLPPVPFRGKRNECSYVMHTAEKLAEIKNISLKEVSETTCHNASALFRL